MPRELFGAGAERSVYHDTHHPERLSKELTDGSIESPEKIKGRYYLMKILHLLLPKQIPNVHLARSRPNLFEVEKKELHLADEAVRQRFLLAKQDQPIPDKIHLLSHQAQQDMKFDDRREELVDYLQRLGLSVDATLQNFARDTEGNLIYFDSFSPWEVDRRRGEVSVGFTTEALEDEINQLKDVSAKSRALFYLSRLQGLYRDEATRLKIKQDRRSRPTGDISQVTDGGL